MEFALIAPVLVVMVLGLVAFGIFFMYCQTLQELTASAARASVVGLSAAERSSLVQQFVAQSISSSGILNASDLSVQTSTSGSPATDYTVTATYNLKDTALPLLASIVPVQFSGITRSSTIEFGGY